MSADLAPALEAGGQLEGVQVAYETWGELAPDRTACTARAE